MHFKIQPLENSVIWYAEYDLSTFSAPDIAFNILHA